MMCYECQELSMTCALTLAAAGWASRRSRKATADRRGLLEAAARHPQQAVHPINHLR